MHQYQLNTFAYAKHIKFLVEKKEKFSGVQEKWNRNPSNPSNQQSSSNQRVTQISILFYNFIIDYSFNYLTKLWIMNLSLILIMLSKLWCFSINLTFKCIHIHSSTAVVITICVSGWWMMVVLSIIDIANSITHNTPSQAFVCNLSHYLRYTLMKC